MSSKFTCPYCYGEHTVETSGMMCSFNIPGSNDTCRSGVTKDADGWIENRFKGKCMKCTAARKRIYCPEKMSSGILYEIPTVFLSGSSLPIALIGAKASGKSNYIAVLINEIRKKMSNSFSCALDISCSEESKRYYDEYYYDPLYNQSRVVEATDATEIPPLIFPLRFMDPKKHRIKNIAALTFYDTAGENLDSSDAMDVMNKYIPNSKGIILLLDPLQVPAIRQKLQGKMPLPAVNTDTVEILSRVTQSIRAIRNLSDRKMIDIPLALAFTKIDALEQFDLLPDDSCLREESEHLRRGGFVMTDFENTNIAMRDLLENFLDGEILTIMSQYSKCAIFGLTALGGVPNGSKISGNEIRPRRVLDPLLWILSENKYIERYKR